MGQLAHDLGVARAGSPTRAGASDYQTSWLATLELAYKRQATTTLACLLACRLASLLARQTAAKLAGLPAIGRLRLVFKSDPKPKASYC